jgi:hypothetical protein
MGSLPAKPYRWYFLALGWAMGREVFNALTNDQEFLAVPPRGADPRHKLLVRLYFPCANVGPAAQAVFRGMDCPQLDANRPPKPLESLEQAYRTLMGYGASSPQETPIVLVLADDQFDPLMRGYQLWLNQKYMQQGALPITNLVYCDDQASADALCALLELKDSSARHEQTYQREKLAGPAPAIPSVNVPPPVSVRIPAPAAASVDVPSVVTSVVNQYKSRIVDKYIFFAPNIPSKKLENVLASYAKEARGEPVLVLIDNTGFGSAKDGGLITDRHIYAHNSLSAPSKLDLCEIQSVEFVEKFPSYPLMINGYEFLQTAYPEKPSMRLIKAMLLEIVARLHAAPTQAPVQPVLEGKSPVAMIKELKDLLDVGAITQQEFDEKRQKYLALL